MIVLSVFLIASVVTIVDSIDLTVLTIYNYTRAFTPIIPRAGRLSVDPDLVAQVRATRGVDGISDTSGFFFNVNTVFGPFPFVCFAVSDQERSVLLARAGDRLASGRMPLDRPNAAEAVLSEGLVRNKKLKLGDIVATPADTGATFFSLPVPVRLVGILKGPTWIAFTSKPFAEAALPFMPHSLLVTTKKETDQLRVGDMLNAKMDKGRVEVFAYNDLVKQLRTSLASMYLIMHLVNATVILVVAMMSGLLSNIYFTQRITEFATLSAIGLRRSILVWHAVSETAIVTAIGWVLGALVNFTAMSLMQHTVFEPRGMLIDPADPNSYLNTIPIPIFITLFAVATITFRLSRLDPVTIIERR